MMSCSGGFTRRQVAMLLIMAIPACMADWPTGPASPLLITGSMTPLHQAIRVNWHGVPVTDAKVTVNGVLMPYCCGDLYSGNLPEEAPAGSTLNLKVAAPGRWTFEAAGEVIATPAIISPAAGSTFASTDPIRLEWRTPEDPDRFEICASCLGNPNDSETSTTLGSAREFTLHPDAIVDYGEGNVVAVYARKFNFLKSSGSGEGSSDVLFVARSRDVRLFIRR